MSGIEGHKLNEPTVSSFHHLKQQIYKQLDIDIFDWLRGKQFGQVPRDVTVKELDMFLEMLQIFTSCKLGEVTFEGVI